MELFLQQHACVHAAATSQAGGWSFEDEVLDGLSAAAARRVPAGGEQSIAWIVWHIARIEDVSMNILAAGYPQVLESDGWAAQLNIPRADTGNLMHLNEVLRIRKKISAL